MKSRGSMGCSVEGFYYVPVSNAANFDRGADVICKCSFRDEEQRVAESFDLKRVADPTAFKSKQGTDFVLLIWVPTFCTHMVDT